MALVTVGRVETMQEAQGRQKVPDTTLCEHTCFHCRKNIWKTNIIRTKILKTAENPIKISFFTTNFCFRMFRLYPFYDITTSIVCTAPSDYVKILHLLVSFIWRVNRPKLRRSVCRCHVTHRKPRGLLQCVQWRHNNKQHLFKKVISWNLRSFSWLWMLWWKCLFVILQLEFY